MNEEVKNPQFKKSKPNKSSKKNIIIISVIALVLIIGIVLFIVLSNKKESSSIDNTQKEETKEEIKPKLKIVNEDSKSRPYAVMINNHPTARAYHHGLQDAYIIYEIIVEGGMTRYLALFKDQDTAKIGSVRSSRHYFLDYALENDAYYVHWGWSPQAESDIRTLGINNINGLTYEGTYFYRETFLVSLEHRGFTTMEMLKKATAKLNYRSETNKDLLLNYSIDTQDLSQQEEAKEANTVTIRYSNSITDKYVYDKENEYYLRYVNNSEHVDYATKEQYHFKNIITYQVANSSISNDEKGRQDISNIGEGTGYYITNGYSIPIKWKKTSRESQTKYYYTDGKELKVNDGNTFIQIQPKNETVSFE